MDTYLVIMSESLYRALRNAFCELHYVKKEPRDRNLGAVWDILLTEREKGPQAVLVVCLRAHLSKKG